MTREDKKNIERRTYWHDIFRQLRGIPDFPVKLFFLALYLVGAGYVATKQVTLREQVKLADSSITRPTPVNSITRMKKGRSMGPLANSRLSCSSSRRRCWRSCSIHLADGRQKTSFNASVS